MPFLQAWMALTDQSVLTAARALQLSEAFTAAAAKARGNSNARVAARWVHRHTDGGIFWLILHR